MKVRKSLDLTLDIYHNCPGYLEYEMTNVRYAKIFPRMDIQRKQ